MEAITLCRALSITYSIRPNIKEYGIEPFRDCLCAPNSCKGVSPQLACVDAMLSSFPGTSMTHQVGALLRASAPGLRATKVQNQREKLIEVSLELFSLQGFEETSVNDIAEKLDISPRTFFRYFKTKEEVVFQFSDAQEQYAVEALRLLSKEWPPRDAMKLMFGMLSEAMDNDLEKSIKTTRLIFNSPSLGAYAHYRFAQAEKNFSEALTPAGRFTTKQKRRLEVEVAVVVAAYVAAIKQWIREPRITKVSPWVLEAFEVI